LVQPLINIGTRGYTRQPGGLWGDSWRCITSYPTIILGWGGRRNDYFTYLLSP
jgi:hypothetical protein